MTIKVDGVDLSQWKSTERSVWGKGSRGSNHLVTLVKKSPMEFYDGARMTAESALGVMPGCLWLVVRW